VFHLVNFKLEYYQLNEVCAFSHPRSSTVSGMLEVLARLRNETTFQIFVSFEFRT